MSPVTPHTLHSAKYAMQGSSNSTETSSFEDDSAFLAALSEANFTPPIAATAHEAVHDLAKGKKITMDVTSRQAEERDFERSIALAEEEEEKDEARQLTHLTSVVRIGAHREASLAPYRASTTVRKGNEASLKRTRFDDADAASAEAGGSSASVATATRATAYLESTTYAPTKFGDFRSFMKNKRAKLKVQESSIVTDEADVSASAPPLFAGTNVYINGHTDPPYNELRRLLLLYGGSHMAYIDTKSPCTHIIASSLTPKKRIEFKDYRVVTPQWITASIAADKRLDWRTFRCGADAAGALGFGVKPGASAQTQQTQQTQNKGADWRQVGQAVAASQSQKHSLAPSLRTVDPRTSLDVSSSSSSGASGAKHLASAPSATFAAPAVLSPKATAPWGMQSAQQTLGTWVSRPATAAVAEAKREATPPPSTAHEVPSVTLTTPGRAQTAALAGISTPPTSSATTAAAASRLLDGSAVAAAPASPAETDAETSAFKPNALQLLGQRTPSRKADPHPIYGAYASRPSNVSAARLLSSAAWRQSNTACADTYLARYFAMSRLHHLSTWKLEMQDMVAQAVLESGRAEGSTELPVGVQRVIFHVDFDAFFVNVGLRRRRELLDLPVVVCHGSKEDSAAPLASTSEIASCNYVAREKGVRNGMSLGNARKLCKDVNTIPYDFDAYSEVSIQLYTVLLAHADVLEAVSVDEALLDVSKLLDSMRRGEALQGGEEDDERRALMEAYRGHVSSQGEAWTEEKQLAEALRDRVRQVTGCEVSIGVASDVLQARLATRKAKPAGSFHLRPEAVLDFTATLEVDDLHGVGWKMRGECQDRYGTVNIGELRERVTQARLISDHGAVAGPKLWNKLHGRERDRLEGYKVRKSLSACVNYGIRFVSRAEAEDFVLRLCNEVSRRLKKAQLRGGKVIVDIMVRKASAPVEAPKFLGHGLCDKYHKSKDPPGPIVEGEEIFKLAWPMIKLIAPEATELRGVAISMHKLEPVDGSAPSAPAPPPGQSLLKFQPVARPAVVSPINPVPVQPEQDEEDNESPPLRPGISAPSRRSLTPEPAPRVNASPPKSVLKVAHPAHVDADTVSAAANAVGPRKLPLATLGATQFAIPSISQIDAGVLSELPRHIVAQVEAARLSRAASEDAARALSAEPPTRQEQVQQRSKASTVRAKSISPLKRKSSALAKGSGSSKLPLPDLHELDPEVLDALPSEIREEIFREAGIRSRSAAGTRSLSESPRKKQRTFNRLVPRSATSGSLQPLFVGKADQPRVKGALQAVDPASVTKEQLTALEIDADFYAGLPKEVQRELLLQQERVVESKRRRFKGGRRIQERTTAQERRFDAEKAAKLADLKAAERGDYVPLVLALMPKQEAPSIRGRSETHEVIQLLEGWYTHFRTKGPRETDVERFKAFLQECVTPQHARSIEMDKAATILKCWKRLLSEETETNATGELEARDKWNAAFDAVYDHISERVRQRFGFGLSLK